LTVKVTNEATQVNDDRRQAAGHEVISGDFEPEIIA
jgi:hypothetical protein